MDDTSEHNGAALSAHVVNNFPRSSVIDTGIHSNAEETTPPVSSFRILNEQNRPFRNFGLISREMLVQIDRPQPHENPYEWLRRTFSSLANHLVNDTIADQDFVGFTITNVDRANQRPIGLSLRRKDQFSSEVLLQLIERCAQSSEELFITGRLEVKFLHVHMPITGRRDNPPDKTSYMPVTGRRDSAIDHRVLSASKPSLRRKGVIRIKNRDNLCLARALVVAIALEKKDESAEAKRYFDYVRRSNPNRRQNRQTIDAKSLCEQANVDLTKNGGGIFELQRLQEYLKDFTITVFTDVQRRGTMFEGPPATPDHPRRHLNLLFENNHYNVIS